MNKIYTVVYTLDELPQRYQCQTSVIPGYSTVADIPKIIAVRVWGNAEKADRIEIESIVKN